MSDLVDSPVKETAVTTPKPRKKSAKRAPRKRKSRAKKQAEHQAKPDVPAEAMPALGQSTSNDPAMTRPPNPTTEQGWTDRMNANKPNPNQVSGKDLMREPGPDAVGAMREIMVWIGVREDCPVHRVTLVGTTFSKRTEQIIPDPAKPGQRLRVPVVGVITKWTKTTFDALCGAIPMRIIRWDKKIEGKPRHGRVVRIPPDKENEDNVKRGRAARYHTDKPDDEPIAKYLYVVFFRDDETPVHGRQAPPTMDVTGLEWPQE